VTDGKRLGQDSPVYGRLVLATKAPSCRNNASSLPSAWKSRRRETMAQELEKLVERARKIEMTPGQVAAQRQSFAYGNTHIENERITREMVAEADRKIAQGK
jgi:hypothetical protein